MKTQKLLRQVHHWGSLAILLQMGLVIGAGLLLMLKKEIEWIQPPTAKGATAYETPSQSFEALFAVARSVDELGVESWRDLARVDVKPKQGVVKFVGANNWEAQVDLATGEVLQVAYRRSDVIESLHDGSLFADWAKLYLFFPSGVVLLVLWGTGVYLFFLQHWKKARNRRSRRARGARPDMQDLAGAPDDGLTPT
ncbi:MAG: PepSY domain-containing protein [Parvularculaceae bacterium]